MIKVSVIVPVYNTEKYLGICLSSLVHQTFKDFEIIVINDGSTDNSQRIIDDYKKEYPKLIKSFSFPNQGISKSRNIGITKAKGKYITFIDSDDYVDITFLEEMYNKITFEKADLCVCDYYTVNEEEEIKKFKIDDFPNSSLKDNPELLLKVNPSPWNKLFKKELFKNLKFENIKYEDLLLVTKILLEAKKIVKLNKYLNFYRIRENSQTTIMDTRVFDILKILEELNAYFKDKKVFTDLYCEIEYFNIRRLMIYVIQQRHQKDKDIRERFISASFNFLDDNFPNWRKNKYYKKRNILKRMIESHRLMAQIYVNSSR